MKITRNLIWSILMLTFKSMLSQTSSLVWERCYGGIYYESAYDIAATIDGGYIVAGSAFYTDGDVSQSFGVLDYWIVKISSTGDIQWEKSLGGTQYDEAYSIKQTDDGGYIVAGTSKSNNVHVTGNHGAKDFWVVKLSEGGAIEWQHSYGGPGDDIPYEIEPTSDGGYVIVGLAYAVGGDVSEHFGLYDGWIVKVSHSGELQWQKSFGGSQHDIFKGVRQTDDGSFIVSGQSASSDGHLTFNHGSSDLWLLKLDHQGELEWQRVLGGSEQELGSKVLIAQDNGYFVAGYTESNDGDVTNYYEMGDFWLVKLDESGTIVWDKNFGGYSAEILEGARNTNDGGVILCGFSRSSTMDVTHFNGGLGDYWIMKASAEGILEWQISVGGSDSERAYAAVETADGGVIATGYTESNNGDVSNNLGIGDFWAVKVAGPNGLGYKDEQKSNIELFPNPSIDQVTLTNIPSNTVITIRNSVGAKVYETISTSSSQVISTSSFTQGIYFVELGMSVHKLVILR